MPKGKRPVCGFRKGYDPRRNLSGNSSAGKEAIAIRKMTFNDLVIAFNKLCGFDMASIVELAKDPKTKAMERIIAAAILEAAKGNLSAMNVIFERMVGKVPDNIEIKGQVTHELQLDGALQSIRALKQEESKALPEVIDVGES